MYKMEGFYGTVIAVEGKIVSFTCGAKHAISVAYDIMVGDTILIDAHGAAWKIRRINA